MKKLICLLFVFTFILTSLCSCHGSDGIPAFELPESFDTNEPIEITFWAKNDTNVAMSDVYRKAIADFQKIYPNTAEDTKKKKNRWNHSGICQR